MLVREETAASQQAIRSPTGWPRTNYHLCFSVVFVCRTATTVELCIPGFSEKPYRFFEAQKRGFSHTLGSNFTPVANTGF
jgi:hypothetical protein